MPVILPSSLHLHELALFAGAGGGILGGKLLGWKCVCAVEWDAYARDVLVARQNDGCLYPFPIWDDIQTFDGRPWRGRVDVVSGGFPCQDISAAGKGAGIEGERSGMWKHMARVIGEVRPRFVLVENSPMLVGRGLAVVLADLAEMGYDAEWGIVGAHHVAAPHKRDRIWIVATDSTLDAGEQRRAKREGLKRAPWAANGGDELADTAGAQDHAKRGDCECGRHAMGRNQETSQRDDRSPDHLMPCGCRGHVANTESIGGGTGLREDRSERDGAISSDSGGDVADSLRVERQPRPRGRGVRKSGEELDAGWWATEPDVGRVAHGVAARVDRLRCIGNGQVSRVVPLAWNLLKPKK
jgi:DNA (cytosine-5)-methyltransferase 1